MQRDTSLRMIYALSNVYSPYKYTTKVQYDL